VANVVGACTPQLAAGSHIDGRNLLAGDVSSVSDVSDVYVAIVSS
jgi:hypothetical protein